MDYVDAYYYALPADTKEESVPVEPNKQKKIESQKDWQRQKK